MSFQSQVSRRSVIRRSKEIATVFLKYGIPIETLFPGIHIHLTPKIGSSNIPLNKRLRLALQELGPIFIKFGQMMSTRPDIVSPEVALELKLLTDNVTTLDWALIEPVIEEYVNPIDETFVSLDKQPFAAASLSQAHLGSLKDGTRVVLKVQRPGIKDTVELDLHILKVIAKAAKSSPELDLFNVPQAIEDFSHQMLSEIDFTRDGRNAELLARNMQRIDGIRIPKIYWQYSGQRLLVLEYVKGVRIDKIEQIKKMGVDPKQIAILGFKAYWKQVFDDGFFHGDPHPGNLLVLDSGELVFLDFGLFGMVRPEKRDLLLKLVLGLVERDIDLIVDALGSFGLVVDDSWVDGFKDDLYRVLVENGSKSIEPDIRLLDDLVELLRRYRLVVPTSLVLMIKVFGMVQDVCSKLYPEFIFLQEAKPLLAKSFRGRIKKEVGLEQVGLSLFEKFDSLQEFPKNVNLTLKQLSKGIFVLKIPDDDLLRLERISDRASFRILLGLVIASVVVGMSLVMLAAQSVLVAVPVQVTLLVYALAILIILLTSVQLMRSRNKH